MRPGRAILAALGLAILPAAAPDLAGGATVGVTVDGTTHTIVLDAAAGETNTVTLGVVGELRETGTFSVADAASPTVATAGCTGGGPPGSTVTCTLPPSALPCVVRGCPAIEPVTNRIEINLGDGDDSLDSTGVPARDGGTGTLSVLGSGGPGADVFTDGPNSAVIDPGEGADSVSAGDGFDLARASTGSPDAADAYALGDGEDTIAYNLATYPVTITFDDLPNDGGAGEGDQVLGAEVARGGLAGDRLVGADYDSGVDALDGFAGDDVIIGLAGPDDLSGGAGDDVLRGQAGRDRLFGDSIGPGDGNDRLSGGNGKDFLEGFNGRDRLRGGFGADQLLGATSVQPDDVVDRVDCGPTRDRLAYVGPEDRVRRCERTRVARG